VEAKAKDNSFIFLELCTTYDSGYYCCNNTCSRKYEKVGRMLTIEKSLKLKAFLCNWECFFLCPEIIKCNNNKVMKLDKHLLLNDKFGAKIKLTINM